MTSPLLVASFAVLGSGLAATSVGWFLLWRKARAMRRAGGMPVVVPVASQPRDEVSRRLDELAARQRALEARLERVEASGADPAGFGPILAHPGGPKAGRRVDPGLSSASAGPTLISVPDLAAPPGSTSEAAAELDRRFGPVWGMADDGMPVDAIARETGYPIGQVELILGLRRKLVAVEAGPDA